MSFNNHDSSAPAQSNSGAPVPASYLAAGMPTPPPSAPMPSTALPDVEQEQYTASHLYRGMPSPAEPVAPLPLLPFDAALGDHLAGEQVPLIFNGSTQYAPRASLPRSAQQSPDPNNSNNHDSTALLRHMVDQEVSTQMTRYLNRLEDRITQLELRTPAHNAEYNSSDTTLSVDTAPTHDFSSPRFRRHLDLVTHPIHVTDDAHGPRVPVTVTPDVLDAVLMLTPSQQACWRERQMLNGEARGLFLDGPELIEALADALQLLATLQQVRWVAKRETRNRALRELFDAYPQLELRRIHENIKVEAELSRRFIRRLRETRWETQRNGGIAGQQQQAWPMWEDRELHPGQGHVDYESDSASRGRQPGPRGEPGPLR